MLSLGGITFPEIRLLFRRKKRVLQEKGAVPFLKDLALTATRAVFSYYKGYLYEETLDNDLVVPPHRLGDLEVKLVFIPKMTLLEYEGFGEESFDFSSHPCAQEDVPDCSEASEAGTVMLYATHNGEFVHRNAAVLSGKGTFYEQLQRRICPPFFSMDDRRTVYRALCVTNPKYRGKGVYKHFEFALHNFMRKKGFSRLLYTVDPDMMFDVILFDKLEGSEAKFKFHRLTLLTFFNFIWVKPCTEPPIVELGIASK